MVLSRNMFLKMYLLLSFALISFVVSESQAMLDEQIISIQKQSTLNACVSSQTSHNQLKVSKANFCSSIA